MTTKAPESPEERRKDLEDFRSILRRGMAAEARLSAAFALAAVILQSDRVIEAITAVTRG